MNVFRSAKHSKATKGFVRPTVDHGPSMSTRPLISVVMPTFNRLEYLEAAVASVYTQSLDDWELIIVDDGSNEATRRFLSTLDDSRILVEFHARTGVPAVLRNRAIARARGRYVAFLDSDDQWTDDKLRSQLALMQSAPARRWSYTDVRRVDPDGNLITEPPSAPWRPHAGTILEQLLRIDAQVAMSSVMAELELVREAGGFDESMRFIEDYDLWSRLAMRSEVSVSSAPLTDHRSHPEQFSWDRIGRLTGWAQYYAKMEGLVTMRHLKSFCRRQKREHVLLVAAAQAHVRDWAGMRGSLVRAARTHALSPRGWLRVAKAAALSSRI